MDETTLWEIVSMCLKFLVSVTLDDYNRGEVSSLIFYFANVWLATMKVEIFVTILWHDDHCEGEVLGSFWLLRVGKAYSNETYLHRYSTPMAKDWCMLPH